MALFIAFLSNVTHNSDGTSFPSLTRLRKQRHEKYETLLSHAPLDRRNNTPSHSLVDHSPVLRIRPLSFGAEKIS
eukprot:1088803-Amorphochlora_amoeboformis.AAC.1